MLAHRTGARGQANLANRYFSARRNDRHTRLHVSPTRVAWPKSAAAAAQQPSCRCSCYLGRTPSRAVVPGPRKTAEQQRGEHSSGVGPAARDANCPCHRKLPMSPQARPPRTARRAQQQLPFKGRESTASCCDQQGNVGSVWLACKSCVVAPPARVFDSAGVGSGEPASAWPPGSVPAPCPGEAPNSACASRAPPGRAVVAATSTTWQAWEAVLPEWKSHKPEAAIPANANDRGKLAAAVSTAAKTWKPPPTLAVPSLDDIGPDVPRNLHERLALVARLQLGEFLQDAAVRAEGWIGGAGLGCAGCGTGSRGCEGRAGAATASAAGRTARSQNCPCSPRQSHRPAAMRCHLGFAARRHVCM